MLEASLGTDGTVDINYLGAYLSSIGQLLEATLEPIPNSTVTQEPPHTSDENSLLQKLEKMLERTGGLERELAKNKELTEKVRCFEDNVKEQERVLQEMVAELTNSLRKQPMSNIIETVRNL